MNHGNESKKFLKSKHVHLNSTTKRPDARPINPQNESFSKIFN